MFLFVLVWNVVLFGEASNIFSSQGSVNFTEIDTNNASSNPNSMMISKNVNSPQNPPETKRKRNPPGKPDPNSEVIALSPKTLLATNRFVCNICLKGFQREQNLQLHMRGHNVKFELKRKNSEEIRKKVYICPESTCVHHNPLRALGDLTGIKKHFSRKHGEKSWKCNKCPKVYAVESDLKAHSKTCGSKEYQCDVCSTVFSRKDNFVSHRGFCVALADESARISANTLTQRTTPPPLLLPARDLFNVNNQTLPSLFSFQSSLNRHHLPPQNPTFMCDPSTPNPGPLQINPMTLPTYDLPPPKHGHLRASNGSHLMGHVGTSMTGSQMPSQFMGRFGQEEMPTWQKGNHLTRDFMGLTSSNVSIGSSYDANVGLREALNFTGMTHYERPHTSMRGEGEAKFVFAARAIWK